MITAIEAKALYDQSGVEVKQFLEHTVEPAVVKAAQEGKRTVFIHVGAEETWKNITPTAFETAVVNELGKLMYRVQFGKDTSHTYVPRGLANDNGEGPKHNNYGFTIAW